MSYAIVTSQIPRRITRGESISWTWSDERFPASSWTLTYSLVSATQQIQITATANGSEHLVEVPSTTTDDYVVGDYSWQAHVAKAGERYKVAEGSLSIVTDYAEQAAGYDSRSHVKKVLDALEAAIEGRASKTQVSQSVNGVAIQHMTLQEQVTLRDHYAMKYRKEQAKKGQGSSRRTLKSRFVN